MTRRLTALLAGLEALLVVAIGLALPLVPLTVVWAVHFGFDPDWTVFWRASADVWLLGHGVDVTFRLDGELAAALELPAAGTPVPVTIALLGLAFVTVLLAARAGRRIAEAGHRLLGGATAVVVFAAASLGAAATAVHPMARPSLSQSLVLPALVFAVGLAAGMLRTAPATADATVRERLERVPSAWRTGIAAALRAGAGAVALTVAVASVLVALLFVVDFAAMIGLYEALHTEVLGGVALTLAQFTILPNLVIWAVAWLVGPGFAIGVGSQVSPLGTALGPMPALPVLGAIPTADVPFGFAGLLVPVVAGFLAAVAVRPALTREFGTPGVPVVLGVAAGAGIVGGALIGLLAAASAGAAGPGRLAVVGPDPVLTGVVAAIEFGVAAAIGLLVTRLPARDRAARD